MKSLNLNFFKLTFLEIFKLLFNSYGYHVSNNSYYLCYEQENIQKMFHRLRHFENLTSEEFSVYFFIILKKSK